MGFSVQVVKGTALTSIIGFVELTRAGTVVTNATYRPFLVYGLVALIYFCLCWPLSKSSQILEGSSMSLIDITEVRKSFGSNEVLKGINLSVQPGEVIAIIGKSGSASRRCCAASMGSRRSTRARSPSRAPRSSRRKRRSGRCGSKSG